MLETLAARELCGYFICLTLDACPDQRDFIVT